MSVPPTIPHHKTPLLLARIQNDLTELMRSGSFPGRHASLHSIRLVVESFAATYHLDAIQGHHRGDDFDEPVPPAVHQPVALAVIGGGN